MHMPLQTAPVYTSRVRTELRHSGIGMSGDGCSNGHWCCQDSCGMLNCVDCGSAVCYLPHSWFCEMNGMTASNSC